MKFTPSTAPDQVIGTLWAIDRWSHRPVMWGAEFHGHLGHIDVPECLLVLRVVQAEGYDEPFAVVLTALGQVQTLFSNWIDESDVRSCLTRLA